MTEKAVVAQTAILIARAAAGFAAGLLGSSLLLPIGLEIGFDIYGKVPLGKAALRLATLGAGWYVGRRTR